VVVQHPLGFVGQAERDQGLVAEHRVLLDLLVLGLVQAAGLSRMRSGICSLPTSCSSPAM
jgi:hypothetical protein